MQHFKDEVIDDRERRQMAMYRQFRELPDEERTMWREIAKRDLDSLYETGGHTHRVRGLIEKLAQEFRRLEAVKRAGDGGQV